MVPIAFSSQQLLQTSAVEADDHLVIYRDHRNSSLPCFLNHLFCSSPIERHIELGELDSFLRKKLSRLVTVGSGLGGVEYDVHSALLDGLMRVCMNILVLGELLAGCRAQSGEFFEQLSLLL